MSKQVRGRFNRLRAVLLALALLIGASALITLPASPAFATGAQATVGMPFSGKWAWSSPAAAPYNDNVNDSHPAAHETYYANWATDLYAFNADVTAVVSSNDGAVTLSISSVTDTSCHAGKRVKVQAKVAGNTIGYVSYEHLDTPLAIGYSGAMPSNNVLGKTKFWGDDDNDGDRDTVFSCYVVTGNSGVHSHVSFTNASGYACYVDLGQPGSTTLTQGTAFGKLGDTGATDTQQACDSSGGEDTTEAPLNDVFQADGSASSWRLSANGTSSWQQLKVSTTTTSSLMIGDFDNDGKEDDVFQATGVTGVGWRVSYGGSGGWQSLKDSTTTKDSLLLGDFDEDGYNDDIFQASGVSGIGWRVSYNGSGAWLPLKDSTATVDTLLLGDFDSDGYRDDVFQASGDPAIGWRVSYNGTDAWQTLKLSTVTKDTLLIGDFDNEGYSNDLLQASGDAIVGWRVSYGGSSGWQSLKDSTATKITLLIGDFDGDGHNDDLFQADGSASSWRLSANGTSSWQQLKVSTAPAATLLLGEFD